MALDCIVKNGKLVIPKFGILEADLGIKGEKIVNIGKMEIPDGARVIDAKGRYVFPGCVDPHTHYAHWNEFYSEMESESKCLAFLGITTSVILIDRCIKNMEGWKEKTNDPELFVKEPGMLHAMWKASYKKVFPEVIEKSEKVSTNDFAFHLLMENMDHIKEIPDYYKEFGIASFKFWTGLEGPAALTLPETWVFLRKCKEVGVLPYANCVNREIELQATREAEERAKTDKSYTGPIVFKESRPSFAETLDLQAVLYLAKVVGVPELLIAHVTYRDSVELIRHYRREHGLNVEGEVCAAWLSFWWPDVGKELGYLPVSITPQLGYKEDVDILWEGLRTGDITCVGTDAAVAPSKTYPDGKPNPHYKPQATKERPGPGFSNHNCIFPVVLHLGMKRGLSLTQIAEVCAYNPARLMRLLPKKGTLAIGSDADLVIMDIGTPHIVRKEELHTASQFSPWDGWELNCWPTLTMLRGQVIFENGKLLKEKTGKYLPRYPFGVGR